MRPLIIDKLVEEKLRDMVKYAKEHVLTEEILQRMEAHELRPVGDMKGHTVHIPVGYKVVLSHEVHNYEGDMKMVRHMSMSVNKPNKLPSVESALMVMKFIGFDNGFRDATFGVEEMDGGFKAINIAEEIK